MDRLTTDNPDTNVDALLNLAFAGDDKNVKLRIHPEDIDLCEYISRMAAEERNVCFVSPKGVMEGACMECDLRECPYGTLNFVATQAAELRGRLKMIEDILGDTYDLDHLRELMTADREGRIHIQPYVVKPGDTLYIVGYIDSLTDVEILGPRYVVRTTSERIYYKFDNTRKHSSILDVSWDDIGKRVFLSREDAEAALAKMKEEEK